MSDPVAAALLGLKQGATADGFPDKLSKLPAGVYRWEAVGEAIDELEKATQAEHTSASFTVYAEVPLEMVDTATKASPL